MDKIESHVEFVSTYATAFRRHYQLNYYHTGRPYEWYEPAYCLGYELVTIHGWGRRAWPEVERKAQRQWKKRGHDLSSWEEVKGAIEHGWNEAREGVGLQDVDDYQEHFDTHYQNTYGATGHAYDNYEPAYRYGVELAYDERYMRRLWPEVEAEASEGWRARHETPWDSVREAVEHAWMRARDPGNEIYEETEVDDDFFRHHYTDTYASGRPYEYYAPAYHFGYDLAYKRRYRDRPWEEIEPQVQREWESAGQATPWEEIKGAVHHTWREVQKAFALRE